MTSVVREVAVDRLDVPNKHSAARPPHLAADGQAARVRSSSLSSSSAVTAGSSSSAIEESVTPPPSSPVVRYAVLYSVGRQFDPHAHWYPRALNAQLHPMVATFLSLGNERIAERYHHLNPAVDKSQLLALLHSECKHFQWSGADLFNVTNSRGKRQMVVIETNSCPSGQKSMPPTNMEAEDDGYHTLMRTTFRHLMEHSTAPDAVKGALAVIYDKNDVEASGYAAAMVDVFNEPVYLAELYIHDTNPPVVWRDGIMHVRDEHNDWQPIRAAFRYVTQKPWQRIPLRSRTLILNPIAACLAGGRNKMIADKAYEFFNHELHQSASGLQIRTPETVRDVSKSEIPLWVKSMGGHAVIKIPYSNAGQGVYTITNQSELDAFMAEEHHYDKFIVQSLVGNASWATSSRSPHLLFHAGTIPNKRLETFVCDLRCMISSTPSGFQPLAMYARRALLPLKSTLASADDSWQMLGTNLSIKKPDGTWTTDTSRLLLMDCKDFNRLGIAIDDLIEAYVQTVLATLAIDRMAARLTSQSTDGHFDRQLYASLNNDQSLIGEIME